MNVTAEARQLLTRCIRCKERPPKHGLVCKPCLVELYDISDQAAARKREQQP